MVIYVSGDYITPINGTINYPPFYQRLVIIENFKSNKFINKNLSTKLMLIQIIIDNFTNFFLL